MAYDLGQIDPEERTDLYADPREEDYAPRSTPAVARRCGACGDGRCSPAACGLPITRECITPAVPATSR